MKCSAHDCPHGLDAYSLASGLCLNCIDDERRDLEMLNDCWDDDAIEAEMRFAHVAGAADTPK